MHCGESKRKCFFGVDWIFVCVFFPFACIFSSQASLLGGGRFGGIRVSFFCWFLFMIYLMKHVKAAVMWQNVLRSCRLLHIVVWLKV